MDILDISVETAKAIAPTARVLVVTATTIECLSLHERLLPPLGNKSVLRSQIASHTYYIGLLGKYLVVHTQCEMGGTGTTGSTLTVRDAIEFWNPAVIIMPGIAFGVNAENQKVGDVLISKSIIPYDSKKISGGVCTPRGTPLSSSKILLDRFTNQPTWHFSLGDRNAKLIPTDVLSGETLINDKIFRDALLLLHQTSLGGEMEGAGLSAACDSKNKDWIVIKGICDFADGNKDADKDNKQRIAAKSSVDLLVHVLSGEQAFVDLGCLPHISELQVEELKIVDKDVFAILFERYEKEYEPYYSSRDHDRNLAEKMSFYSIWLHGPAGAGKTASIRRYLDLNDIAYNYLSFACTVGYDDKGMFAYLHGELSELLTGKWENVGLKLPIHEIIKKITLLLTENCATRSIVLYFDEIPVDNSVIFKSFVQHLISLIISTSNTSSCPQIKFVFSSVNSPLTHIPISHRQIFEKMKVIQVGYWIDQEVDDLISLLAPKCKIALDARDREAIKKKAKGSPRIVKTALRDYALSSGKLSFDRILSEIATNE